jgi:hypothetical protein
MSLIQQAGFTGQAAQTMYGIVMAESGGNATAHNGNANTGDNSYGLAQINMLGSMGPARLREFGLSSNDQLYDPATNLRVAYALSDGGKNFTPWTTYTRGTYKQYLGQTGAQVTTQDAGETLLTAPGTAAAAPLTAAQYEQALGSLSGIFQAVPELQGLLNNAIKQQQPVADFTNAVQNSAWYKDHSDTFRQQFALQYSNPAEYQRQLDAESNRIQVMIGQTGLVIGPEWAPRLAAQSLQNGWTDSQLKSQLASLYITSNSQAYPMGQAATQTQQIKQMSQDYGVPVTDQQIAAWNQGLIGGTLTADTVKQQFINSASSLYPGMKDQLAAGQTVKDVASPYLASMAQTLEIDPNTLTVQDPTIQKALQSYQNPVTGSGSASSTGGSAGASSGATAAPGITPLWKFQADLRQDPRWEQTTNAKQDAYSILHTLGQSMGFAS